MYISTVLTFYVNKLMVESNNILSRVDEGFFFSFFFFFKSGGRVLKELSQSQDIHFAL